MSLPSGYTQCEYIQSSGTQYIDTRFKPNNNTRVVMEAQVITAAESLAQYLFGARTASNTVNYGLLLKDKFRTDYGESKVDINFANVTSRVTIDKNKNVCTLNGTHVTNNTASTFQSNYKLYLLASNDGGTAKYHGTAKLYSCQIYDNAALVRDLIPCINPLGEVGMWDTVNGVFYQNSGTGSFIPGAIIITTPDPPGNLAAESDNGTNTLTWDESAYADGYRVYENGILIADTQQTSLTVTSEPYSANIYSVTAYNGDGESEPAVIRAYTSGSRDVLDDLITDRTLLDVTKRTKKGVYNAHDINRVSTAAHRVRTILAPLGYLTPGVPDYRWAVNEIPKSEEMAAHHASVIGQDVINYSKTKIDLPVSLSHLTHEGANNIEKFLRLCGEAAERIPEAYIYSGEIFGGDG